jgi:GTP-binding protein
LEAELAAYQSALDEDTGLGDLSQRPRLVVLNKADVPEAEELAEFLKEDIEKQFGWPVFIISAVARKGLDPLKYKLLEIVQDARKKRPKEKAESVIIKPKAVDHRTKGQFQIKPDPEVQGGFIITGEKPERWILQTDFENDEAVGYLADRLAKLGIEDGLRKAGAHVGANVTIGGISFEWEPMTTAGDDPVLTGRGTDVRLEQTSRISAAERKRASQVRRGLIDELDYGEDQEASRERWEG